MQRPPGLVRGLRTSGYPALDDRGPPGLVRQHHVAAVVVAAVALSPWLRRWPDSTSGWAMAARCRSAGVSRAGRSPPGPVGVGGRGRGRSPGRSRRGRGGRRGRGAGHHGYRVFVRGFCARPLGDWVLTPSGSFHRLEFAVVPPLPRPEPWLLGVVTEFDGLMRVPVSWLRMTTPTTTMATAAETANTGLSQGPAGPRRPGEPAAPRCPPARRAALRAEQAAQEADQGEQRTGPPQCGPACLRDGFEPDEKTGSAQLQPLGAPGENGPWGPRRIQPVTDSLQSVASGFDGLRRRGQCAAQCLLVVPVLCHHACRPGALASLKTLLTSPAPARSAGLPSPGPCDS